MRLTFSGPDRDDTARSPGRWGGTRWRRRAIALVGATSLAVGVAGVAWADSPDPVQNTAVGSISYDNAGNPVLTVQGDWTWPTHKSNCNDDRFAAGYAVDWHDTTAPGYLITGKDKQGNPISARVGTPLDQSTHYTVDANGNRCGTYNPAVGYNSGHWGPISHTYPAGTTSFTACVVTFDLHSTDKNPATTEQDKDKSVQTANDNSIESNGNTPGGNQCANIVIPNPVSVKVEKTNDANRDGTYSTPETAATAGADVSFQLKITNTSAVAETISTITDTYSGAPHDITSCLNVAGGANVVGTSLAAGASVTCRFPITGYSPAAGGSKDNTAVVKVVETAHPNNSATGQDTSTVNTTNAAPKLTAAKDGPATAVAGTTVAYHVTVTNNGNATAQAPIEVFDDLPPGESFVDATGAVCTPSAGAAGHTILSCKIPSSLAGNGASLPPFTVRVEFPKNASGDYQDCAYVDGQNPKSCVTTTVTPALTLTVDKTNDANKDGSFTKSETAATPGQAVDFQVVVTNTSDVPVVIGPITDKWLGLVNSQTVCTTLTGTTLAAHSASLPCTFNEPNYSPAIGDPALVNTVTAVAHEVGNANNGTPPATSDSTVATLVPPKTPVLTAAKTGPATAVGGTQVDYKITVTNSGTGPAPAGSTVFDQLPPGETFVGAVGAACTAAAGPGQLVTCQLPQAVAANGGSTFFTVTVSFPDNASGDYEDCAYVTGQNPKSCVTTNITPVLTLKVDKVNDANQDGTFHDTETANAAGQDVNFQATITNLSKVDVQLDSISDAIGNAAGTPVCDANKNALLAANGGSVLCSFQIKGYAPAAGSLTDTVTATGREAAHPNNPPVNAHDSSTVLAPPAQPNLSVVKTGPATAVSGTRGNYTIEVSNTGAGDKAAPITVTDTLPIGETFVTASVPCTPSVGPGAQVVTCVLNQSLPAKTGKTSFTVTVDFAPNASGILTDCAKVDNSQSCWPTDLTPPLSLTVVKTNDANQDGQYNGTETAKSAGQAVAFHALITNTSKVDVQLDTISDAIGNAAGSPVCDANKNAVLAANGGNVLCTFTLNGYAPAAGSLTDTVTATGHEASDPTNKVNAAGSSTVLAPPPVNAPQLTIVKTGPATAVAGSQAVYTLKVTNNGTATAPAPITVTDTLPAGETFVSSPAACTATAGPGQTVTCVLPQSLAVGDSTSFTVTVAFAATASGNYTDCGKVADSQSCVTTTVQKPDLGIVKTGPTASVRPGDALTYTLNVTNTGPVAVTGFTVTDTLPAGLTLGTLNAGAFTCASGGAISCTYPGTLAPGASAAITFTANLASGYTAASVINTAVVGPNDDTPGDNTSTWITPVEQPGVTEPDLGIVKDGPSSATPGGQVVYTLTVTNTGTVPASGFTVTDPLAIELSFVSANGTGFTCTGPGVNCTYPGVLNPGDKAKVTVVTTLSAGFKGSSVTNTASVGPNDSTPGDNTSTFITPVEQPGVVEPDLGITKTGPTSSVKPGDQVTYTLTVHNTGTVPATGFSVTDELPAALSLVSISGDGFACTGTGPSCTYPGTLAAGASASVTVVTLLSSTFTGTSVKDVGVVGPTDATPGDNRATVTTAVEQPGTPPLPFTGSNTYQMLLSALALLSVGAALVLLGRRRKTWTV